MFGAAGHMLQSARRRGNLPASLFLQPRAKRNTKFRWYVPFMWQPLVACSAGLIVIGAGVVMCVVGFNAEQATLSRRAGMQHNETTTKDGHGGSDESHGSEEGHDSEVEHEGRGDEGNDSRLVKSFVYVGPAVMSVGCFAIVFSCVAVCETRDKVLRLMDENEMCGLPTKANIRIDFYDLVLKPKYFSIYHNRSLPPENNPHQAAEVLNKSHQEAGGVSNKLDDELNEKVEMGVDDETEEEDCDDGDRDCFGSVATRSVVDLRQCLVDGVDEEMVICRPEDQLLFSPHPSRRRTASSLTSQDDTITRRSCPSILVTGHDS